jgi:hypothetical protein
MQRERSREGDKRAKSVQQHKETQKSPSTRSQGGLESDDLPQALPYTHGALGDRRKAFGDQPLRSPVRTPRMQREVSRKKDEQAESVQQRKVAPSPQGLSKYREPSLVPRQNQKAIIGEDRDEQPFTEEKTMAMDQESEQKKKTSQGSQPAPGSAQGGSEAEERWVAIRNTHSPVIVNPPEEPQRFPNQKGGESRWEKGKSGWKKRSTTPRAEVQEGQSERELQRLTPEQQKVEGGITGFFKSLFRGVGELISVSVKSLFSGILGAALLPFFGPVLAIGFSLSLAAAVSLIQDELKPLGLDLRDDTIQKLAEPLQGKQLDESELRKVIEEVLSEDRPANEDLAKAFSKLLPTINKAAAATNIEFSGPVQGLTIGDHNTVTQTFRSFLPKDAS